MTHPKLPSWHAQLLNAAKNRQRVRLDSGEVVTLVYVPAPGARGDVRHGDPNKCGVRFPGASRNSVQPVDIREIAEILPKGKEPT